MTVHRFTDNTDLSVYFHMRSHYRRLKNAKSIIDNSTPLGFMKTSSTPPNSERSWKTCSYEEKYAKDCQHLPNHSSMVRKHDCITSTGTKSDTCVRSASLPPRPKTRRHPFEMPFRQQNKARSQSVGPTSRKDVAVGSCYARTKKKRKALRIKEKNREDEIAKEETKKDGLTNEDAHDSDDECRSNNSRRTTSSSGEKVLAKFRTEEHEYLQFLLRITEDIIINNLYTTEDIEKVFQNHIEANRDRLKMGKMKAQLDKLCKELNISCKIIENHIKSEDCYSNFFENTPHDLNYNQNLDNCECTSKRTLNIEIKKYQMLDNIIEEKEQVENNFQVENDNIASNLNLLISTHSLSRVTECTEPTNSTDTLKSSTKHPSLTTVVSFENITILPCFENLNVGDPNQINKTNEDVECEENVQAHNFSKDPPLTEKEKLGCIEEEILFDKYNSDLEYSTKSNILINEPGPLVTERISITNEIFKDNETGAENNSLLELSNSVKEKEENLHNELHSEPKDNLVISLNNMQQNLNEIVTKLDTSKDEFIQRNTEFGSITEEKQAAEETTSAKCTFDKFTQITVSQCDKECNTNIKLNDCSIRDDYVLINGPVYIPKTVLHSNGKLLLHDNRSVSQRVTEEILPEKLLNNTAIPFNCFGSGPLPKRTTDVDCNSLHFSKLLNSDYDLTPQRDGNTFEKYNHLLLDTSTSVTNLNVSTARIVNLNLDSLLLTEKYSLNNGKEAKEIELSNVQNRTDEKLVNSNYLLLNNELSSDGQYEIKSYSLPEEVNRSVKMSGYSIKDQAESDIQICDQVTELDVSLTAYEIKSEANEFGKQDAEVHLNGKLTESGEIIQFHIGGVDDSSSQISSVRSEKDQRSSSSLTNTKNIWGKRKLQHPS